MYQKINMTTVMSDLDSPQNQIFELFCRNLKTTGQLGWPGADGSKNKTQIRKLLP